MRNDGSTIEIQVNAQLDKNKAFAETELGTLDLTQCAEQPPEDLNAN